MTLSEIIERLEKAEPGDRHLEVDIWRFFNPDADPRRIPLPWVACYTESVDASIALAAHALPTMNCWGIEKDERGIEANVQRNGVNEGHWASFAEHRASAPIALCLAILKAKQMGVGE